MCPNNSSRKEISVCAVQAPQWRSCVESGEDGLGDARLPDGGGAFLRSLSRPNRATGWFDPATPLPDAEVSFHRGSHPMAGMVRSALSASFKRRFLYIGRSS